MSSSLRRLSAASHEGDYASHRQAPSEYAHGGAETITGFRVPQAQLCRDYH